MRPIGDNNCKRSGEKPLKAISETTKTRFTNLSSEDLSKLLADKDSANTKKATDHAVRVFRAYLREKEKVKMVLREEKEIEERKLNLLVFGLPEAAPEASESERLGNDLIQL